MQIQINKNKNAYIGFASNFTCSPIIAKTEKQVLLEIEDEIYRTCNWLSKKPPKDVETFKSVVKNTNCLENDVEFFENGEFTKGEFNDVKLQLVQGLFSYKCMVESVESYDALDSLTESLKGIYFSLTGNTFDGGFLETGFKLIEELEDNNRLDKVKLKAYAYKTLYTVINGAKVFYDNTKDKFKDITNSFCFLG